MKTNWPLYLHPVFLLFVIIAVACNRQETKVECMEVGFVFDNPPFAACHSSTIVELGKGMLMAAWFGGAYEGANDVCIWTSKYHNGYWEKPVKTATGGVDSTLQLPCWNPVLFKARNGNLYLFYKVGRNPREWWGMVKISSDNGLSWSEERRLQEGFLGPVKNKPMQLRAGEILCPSSTESKSGELWRVHLEITDEGLDSWQKVTIDTINNFGVIQPTLLQYPNGRLQMLCRSRANHIVQSWSDNNGISWSNLEETNIPNPNSGIDAVTLSNGLQVLVYNPLLQGTDWQMGRNVLKVAVSDDGLEWKDVYTLENEKSGEFSYPAIIQTKEGLVHITYTYNRINIKHVVLQLR